METYITTNEISEILLLAEAINNALAINAEQLVSATFLIELADSNGEKLGYLVNDLNDPLRVVFSATPELSQ